MFIALKIAGIIVGVWAGFKLGGIAIEWLREGFNRIRPSNFSKDKF
jgi:hypothetical protein